MLRQRLFSKPYLRQTPDFNSYVSGETNMNSSYSVQLISPEEKETLYEQYKNRFFYTNKAEIYGCCIKLLTELENVKNQWEDNFFTMGENTRSHGRLIVLQEPNQPVTIKYDPYTKTAFLINVDYYGWIKSIALAVAGEGLEDGD